jgi:phosphoglycerate dehydrogenase-like enzyme
MKVLIVNPDAAYLREHLQREFPELTIWTAASEDEAGATIEEAEILMAIRASDGFIARARELHWIQSLISGVDFFLELPSLPDDVLVTAARGFHGPQMAELALLHMLSLTRHYRHMLHNQERKAWVRWPQPLLYNKAVGILGVGVIGKEIARKCRAFDMVVYGVTSVKREMEEVDYAYGPEGLLEVMAAVDYFVNVVPNTPATRQMIGERELASLKPSAYFINLGRGETVDEAALIRALQEGKMAGAGLDVFATEPLPDDSPLWEMENVVITPHVGGMSDIYADQVLPVLEANLRWYLHGERDRLMNAVKQ